MFVNCYNLVKEGYLKIFYLGARETARIKVASLEKEMDRCLSLRHTSLEKLQRIQDSIQLLVLKVGILARSEL